MKNLTYFLSVLFMVSCAEQSLQYPQTRKVDVVDNYFGTEVEDPYRWLENDTSVETAAWVEAQNAVTFGYLEQLPFRSQIKQRLTDLLDYPKYGTPFKEAGKYFFFKNDGLQNQSVLYMTETLEGEPSVLLDPNTLSEDGTVALSSIEISEDGKYLVYSIARSGSDWNEVFVKNIETGEMLPDHIVWVKFSGLSWYDGGFFYSAYDAPEAGSELSKSNEYQKVFYHKLGTPQVEDQLIAEDSTRPKRMFGAGVTDDKRFLTLTMSETTHGNALSVKDLSKAGAEFVPFMESFDYEFNVVDNVGDDLFILTNYQAPKYRLVKININRPQEKDWTEIIPEKENVLQSVSFVAGKIVVDYMKDARSEVEVYAYDGTFEYTIQLPGVGSAGAFSGKKDENLAFYSYTSFNTPGEIYQYDFAKKESSLYFRPEVKFNPDDYQVKQEFYQSKDGTRVPLFIVHKKGIELNGQNPALLYGYGGFNISLTPSFSSTRMVFLENGGVLAVANLRGGGEYGEEWHKAGTKLQKQNVFDDFIAAAEYLIAENYTNSDKLAIMGGSNGGLLVGAVTNQRPDLIKVALPAVGVMDMLRFHQFTIGWAWAGDYGTSADSKEMFDYLYGYSPYHNIRQGGNYPAVLVTTADHDDRVVPAHSFKYIARLQEYNTGKLPVLIRIDTKAGHGSGKPTAKVIDEYTDVWSFVFYHLGIKM
ncbi:prolyl oligopeptidase family serine peptidase [Gaoshiqia sediminis]|uniref:prolyl oligopeptidase n=1 Tax=Gaoshiqia sediminis TaxID=2986998 RepID=A0AA42C9J3_9BACT|nr:prolyl oligopeptidase family serine peptidase [Gaoshiqia sediminis]MCW0484036.1 prolyl oligopeptidase family serine peptidase [Gaoshiqia sediminis]